MWQQLIIDTYEQIGQLLGRALDGLTIDDLNQQPHPDCNSMGWLAWHLTRCQNRAISDLMGGEQLWIKYKWHARFNRPPDPNDWGLGHSSEDVAAFKSPNSQTLLTYHHAVLERSKEYIRNLVETDLGRELNNPKFRTVGARLVGLINDNYQHAGQIAYIRGWLKDKGWYGA